MEVILMTNVENLGSLGDIVKVRSGYARNYLLPYGKAQLVTPENLAELEARKAKLEEELRLEREAAHARLDQVHGKSLNITVARATTAGEIDGKIGTFDIVRLMKEDHAIEIERSQVRLPQGALHTVGSHEVAVHFHADLEDAMIQVHIASETVIEDKPEDGGADDVANASADNSADKIDNAGENNGDEAHQTDEGSTQEQQKSALEEDGSGSAQ